jgi:hypothetical protein
MTITNMRDYIGSVRIALQSVIVKSNIVTVSAVLDENRKKCGDLKVSISYYDVPIDKPG